MSIWDHEEKVKIVQLADLYHRRGIGIEGSKGRSEMLLTV